jgi:hypothetical protein
MPIESATYVNQFVLTNPVSNDRKNTSDNQLRLLKSVLKNSFSNINDVVSASAGEMNLLVGVTATLQTQLNVNKVIYAEITAGSATVANAVLWDSAAKFVSTATASGTGTDGDFWFQYE